MEHFNMNRLDNRKKVITLFIFICVLQLALSLFWVSKKNFLFFDEVFSYYTANNVGGEEYWFVENEWMDGHWFSHFLSADPEHTFDYSIPYRNQIADVHPPLFYMFLHTACSFIPGEFSVLSGVVFNILFFQACTIALFFLGKEILGSTECGLLVAFLYGISYGGLNTMVYIRMYMLMTLMVVLHALVYIKYLEKEKVPFKAYFFLALTLVGGVLSQYYFLFIAFFFGVWYTMKFLLSKRYKVLFCYLGTIVISALCSLAMWPAMLKHLFSGGRGEEAQENLLSLNGYFDNLKEMFRIMNNDMFMKLLVVILIGLFVLVVICYKIKKEKCFPIESGKKFAVLVTVCLGYFLLVTKVAPYQVDRYLMPIYPLIYLLVVDACYWLLGKLIPGKFAVALCILGFGGLSLMHMIHSGIPYTYAKNPENIERHALVQEYRDNYALYISDNGDCHFFEPVQMLKEYKGFYHVYHLDTFEKTRQDMKVLTGEKSLVIYVNKERNIEEVYNFIQEVFTGKTLNNSNLLDEDEEWNVYLLDLS